nr:immunoglobulin light chain junction region [Macaca mulatta]MOW57237.1 immunoglobulin light chain junction region [Macaca mulatta]MOW58180.1 immunoglobulin light chain junction region [Macaca mulatta]MOW58392.1 immunoglobulin light chain junction region [Macaca mulatta]MOW58501.1 immunoglobulin light chain junction region [Macaca mulatta]
DYYCYSTDSTGIYGLF